MQPALFYLPTWRSGYGVSLTDYYEQLTETVRLVDSLGWARIFTTEHHFHYYGGAVPNPAVLLAAWARETRFVRLGAGVSLMQLRNPLTVAEDYALLDQLSGGRCEIGVGRGFVPHEFAAFDIDPAEVPSRIEESLEICQAFWSGEPFAHEGSHFSFARIEPWPPAVNGSIPVWQAASRSEESFVRAARSGHYLMMNQYPMSYQSLEEKFGRYCEEWEKSGRGKAGRRSLIALVAHLADSEEQALQEAKGALQEHASAFLKVLQNRQWERDYEGDVAVLLEMCESDDWRDVFRRRTLVGTPGQAVERIQKYDTLGFTDIAIIPRFAGISHQQALATIHCLTEEVFPEAGVSTGIRDLGACDR